jgi:hypothetical protein
MAEKTLQDWGYEDPVWSLYTDENDELDISEYGPEIMQSWLKDKARMEAVGAMKSPLDEISHEAYWGGLVDDPQVKGLFNELDVIKNPPQEIEQNPLTQLEVAPPPPPEIEGPNRVEALKAALGARFGRRRS